MLDSHAQHGQLVQLAGHGVAGGHQRGQLVDEAVHLVPPPLLNLTVSLPGEGDRRGHQGGWHRGQRSLVFPVYCLSKDSFGIKTLHTIQRQSPLFDKYLVEWISQAIRLS